VQGLVLVPVLVPGLLLPVHWTAMSLAPGLERASRESARAPALALEPQLLMSVRVPVPALLQM
jgi:hypothetical protein